MRGVLVFGLVFALSAVLARAATTGETDLQFWQAISDGKTAGDYRAYLATFPDGQFVALARMRAGRDTGAPDQAEIIARAIAAGRRFLIGPSDASQGSGACALLPGTLVSFVAVPARDDTTAQVRVVTGPPGGCAAGTTTALAQTVLQPALDAFAALPQSAPHTAATDAELLFWRSVSGSNPDELIAYLQTYPDGAFSRLAIARLAAQPVTPPPVADAKLSAPPPKPEETETALALTRADWVLIQRSLAVLAHPAGSADGNPGDMTRRAIRAYQGDRGRTQTGYLDADTKRDLTNDARPALSAQEERERAKARARAEALAAEQQRAAFAEAERRRNTRYAAVYRDNNDKFYRSISQASEEEAKTQANSTCLADPSSTTCTFVTTFTNSCFALARDRDGWGWAVRTNPGLANSAALESCGQQNTNCVHSWGWCAAP